MRIAVVGVGGVGGYIGAKLCSSGDSHSVTFIARGAHADAIRRNGLKIVEDDASYVVHPFEITTAEEATGPFDLILLCVKSYDIETSINALRHLITPETIIIPFANGVNHAETIGKLVDAVVLNGAVYILSHIQEDGVIRKKGKVFALIFGDKCCPEAVGSVAALFDEAGIRYKTPDDIETALWKKYLFIAAFANLTSYYDESIRTVYLNHPTEAKQLLEEIAAIAKAKGITLVGEVEKALETAATLPDDASTSMHLDFQQGHQSEIETLCGYLVNEATTHQIEAALLRHIYTTLKEK